MRSRIIVSVVVATLVLGGAASGLGASGPDRAPLRKPQATSSFQEDLTTAQRRLIEASKARVRCRSLGCINRSLNRLAGALGTLGHVVLDCEQYVNVTRYANYAYSSDGGTTFGLSSAIDYTEPGDPVTNRVVVYVC